MSASQESARTPTPASRAPLGGGRSPAPAGRSGSLVRAALRVRESAWFPVVGKATAIAAGMVALSAIGAASVFSGAGVPVASAAPVESAAPARTTPSPASPGAPPPAEASAAHAGPTEGAATNGITADGKVILNQATAEELCKLPRVGAKRAQAIVDLRHRLGHFRQATDLLRVRGIGRKTLRSMLSMLVVDDPRPAEGTPHASLPAGATGAPPPRPPETDVAKPHWAPRRRRRREGSSSAARAIPMATPPSAS